MEALSIHSPKTPNKACQECRKNPVLYQCPRCNFRSCSLECCKAHKVRTGCNGKRDRTAFLPVSRMDDRTMDSDYHFLEDVLGQVESSQRYLKQMGGSGGNQHHKKRQRLEAQAEPHPVLKISEFKGPLVNSNVSHPKWRHFQQQASDRGVQLVFMPPGMQRHKLNKSYVKEDAIYWTVEWCVYSAKTNQPSVRQTTTLVPESAIVEKALPTSIAPSQQYSFLMKKLPSPSNQPKYVQLSNTTTLAEALRDMTVIEYPTIDVVPLGRLDEFPRVIEEIQKQDTES